MNPMMVEKIEILDGSRSSKGKEKAAVRLEDLRPLLELPVRLMSARAAGDPVTPAEYDALVADVHAIHRRLEAVATLLQARLLR